MKVSVIVPVYNSRDTIGAVLKAIREIEYDNLEIVVVDDGSTDGSAEIVREFAKNTGTKYRVNIISQENGGPAKARNTGWRAAKGEICFFTDADCLPDRNVISVLLGHFKDETVGGAGGTYGIANLKRPLARLIHAEIVSRHEEMTHSVNYLGSFNCAYRKRVLEEIGGFNEEYKTASAEDNDLSYRVIKKGYKLVFDIGAVVNHFHETSFIRYLRQQYNHGKWRVKLYGDHRDRTGGDHYGGLFDFIQPPLAVLMLFGIPLAYLDLTRPLYMTLSLFYVILQFPRPVFIFKKTGNPENLLLISVTFFRGFARGFGMLAGLWRFGL